MIDPTSKDDPKFKELVKVRNPLVSACLLGCGGQMAGLGGGVEGEGPSPGAGPWGQGSCDGRAAPVSLAWFLSPGSAVTLYLRRLCVSECNRCVDCSDLNHGGASKVNPPSGRAKARALATSLAHETQLCTGAGGHGTPFPSAAQGGTGGPWALRTLSVTVHATDIGY